MVEKMEKEYMIEMLARAMFQDCQGKGAAWFSAEPLSPACEEAREYYRDLAAMFLGINRSPFNPVAAVRYHG